MGRFSDKVVIVTGSSSGIGQETAIHFAEEGAKVVITGRNADGLERTIGLMNAKGVPEDRILSIKGSVDAPGFPEELMQKTIDKWGQLDVLVNNAAVIQDPKLDINSIENYDYVFNINLRSLILLTQLAIPHLLKTKGNVVNISSVVALKMHKDFLYYCMTKAALDHYTKGMAARYAHEGLRFNNVNPGYTYTPIFTRHDDKIDVKAAMEEMENTFIKACIPQKRFATTREISDGVLFLASPTTTYCNGTCLLIDGGYASETMPCGRFDVYAN